MARSSDEKRRERLVNSALKAGWAKFGASELDDATHEYISGVACSIMADARDPDSGEKELLDQLGPLLQEQDLKEKQVMSLCKAISMCVFTLKPKNGHDVPSQAKPKVSKGETILCRCNDLILMYLGSTELLLQDTTFELLKGHRYGIVGSNGTGKTTLMERIADGAISELAKTSLKFVHIRHETLNEQSDPSMSAQDYANGVVHDVAAMDAALDEVGFSTELRHKALRELSGGWRVRLLLATAVAQCADVLLLDEPTNHLDMEAVQWLVNYLTVELKDATSLVVSHDAPFLDKICSDIIHFDECKLKYYAGNFSRFQQQAMLHEQEEIQAVLRVRVDEEQQLEARSVAASGANGESFRIQLPVPGKVEGIATTKKTVLEIKNASFRYPLAKTAVLKEVNSKVTMSSRIAIIGPNGAGKSTLMSLLCNEIRPTPDDSGLVGAVDRHRSLRLAYIAQSHMFHLKEYERCTPVEYVQVRFRNGYDEELQKRLNSPVNDEEEATLNKLASKFGKYGKRVEALMSRARRGKEWRYEVKWQDLNEKQNTFESVAKLRELGVERMATALDERLAVSQLGVEERPITQREITRHLECFGLSEELVARRSIGCLSGGQKTKLVIGAAFWTKPHVICLDEPTNFLDFETVAALQRSLQCFRGGVVIVSHNEDFLAAICNEIWSVQDQEVTVVKATEAQLCDDNGELAEGS